MKEMIGDREIEFDERPRHKSVVAVQNLMTNWLLANIDLKDIDNSLRVEVGLRQQIFKNPTLLIAVEEMEASMEIDQTIMLSTTMTYKELVALKEDLYEDEYLQMYEASKSAIGGSAKDFLKVYDTDSKSRTIPKILENHTQPLATSEHPQEISSEISTEQ